MLNGYKIIDADSHVIEPQDMWLKYLEPEFKEFAPSRDMKIKGEPITEKISQQAQHEGNKQMMQSHPHAYLNRYSPESHVQAMTRMGVDITFLYPTYGFWLFALDTFAPEVIGAFTRAYNTWLYEEFCSYESDKLKGVAAINLHAPQEMITELERIASWDWKAVFLRPNPVRGRILSDQAYELFWTACEELDIAIGVHSGSHSRSRTTGADRFDSHFAIHTCSHPLEQMMGLLALIEGGVLERHPKLRVGLLEAGCSWLPYWLWRMDDLYESSYWEMKDQIKLKPSEYFYRQCYVAIEPSEPLLSQTLDYIGSDNVIFGSDYPHIDHKPDAIDQFVGLEKNLSPEIIQKISWHNPARFYNLT